MHPWLKLSAKCAVAKISIYICVLGREQINLLCRMRRCSEVVKLEGVMYLDGDHWFMSIMSM